MNSEKHQIGIKWYGRAGHGAVSAGAILGIVFAEDGWQVQAFPDFGAEKRGAPLTVYNRISKKPLRLHCKVQRLDYVIVLDPTLLRSFDITENLRDDGIIIINSEVEQKGIAKENQKVYVVAASKIAVEELGRDIPNIPLVGAFAKLNKDIDEKKFAETVKKALSERFPEKIVEGNMKAFVRACEEVKES